MARDNQYGPEAYRRLDLVRKQFKHQTAEQKKQQTSERNQRILSSIAVNKSFIIRTVVFVILGLLLTGVLITGISGMFMK